MTDLHPVHLAGSNSPTTFDIMMPFYGDPALFKLAVESVRAQTDPDWRLVIIDDQYPDLAPGRWAQSLLDTRIVYQRNEVNLGVSANFAKCVDLAMADFTSILGCDDILLPNYIARMRQLTHQFPDADYLQPGVQVMEASGADALPLADRVKSWYRPSSTKPQVLSGEFLAASLLKGNWTYFPSIAWRTSTLQRHGFRRDLDVVLDLALQLDIVADGGQLVLDPEPAFRYRRHAGSVSSWMADDGTRFVEEARFFYESSERMRALGWKRAGRVAALHFSSRLNAITRFPSALRARDGRGAALLARHVLSFTPAHLSSEIEQAPRRQELPMMPIDAMPSSLSRTLIVMPAFNEEEAIGGVIQEVFATLPGAHCLVVNDGSLDRTTEVARAAGALVAVLPVNLGVGGAMRLGFKYALEHGFENVVQIDSDGQHDPSSVLALLNRLEFADLVIGARFAGTGDYEARGPRRWAMLVLASILSRTAHTRLTDTTSGFKASGPRAVRLFATHYPAEYLGDTIEALVIAARAGCVIEQVPVAMRVRAGGTPSHNPLRAAAYLGRAFVALCFALIRPSIPLQPKV